MSPTPPEIHNRIAELRQERKETQEDLAKALGCSRQTVISIEGLKYKPSLPLAFLIAAHFNTSIEEVFYVHDATVSGNGQHA